MKCPKIACRVAEWTELQKYSQPTPAEDMAAHIITDWGR